MRMRTAVYMCESVCTGPNAAKRFEVKEPSVCVCVCVCVYTELKHVATEDSRYCNVSMEFDTVSLRPTYKLLWGSVGASNALDIARTLGFDRYNTVTHTHTRPHHTWHT